MTIQNEDRPPSELAEEDRQNLARLDAKLQMVRDRVNGVVQGYDTGLYLHGEGGLGKSFTVLQELPRLGADYVLFNSRISGRALYDTLEQFPSSVHVFEDVESLFSDKGAQGVLRSALWAQNNNPKAQRLERLVTWTTAHGSLRFHFTGGIIMIGNRAMDDVPELRAVKTRIACMHLEVSVHELRALMRHIAAKGFEHAGVCLEPAACIEVCEYLIEESASLARSLDMRLLVNSFKDRIQWEEEDAACHWKDLVAGRLRERLTAPQKDVGGGREERRHREQGIVQEILAATQDRGERVRMWEEHTGKSQAAWYRRLDEVQQTPILPFEK